MPRIHDSDGEAETATAVAVVLLGRGRVLFGRRADGAGGFLWQLPGGWIEPGESAAAAARREVLEETGIEVGRLRRVAVVDNGFDRGRRSISAVFEAECADAGCPDETRRGWEWRRWEELDGELFAPLRRFKQTGYRPCARGAPRA